MIMPFGKHRGKDMEDIPSSYLKWVAENIDKEDVAMAADEEWQWREENNQHIYED